MARALRICNNSQNCEDCSFLFGTEECRESEQTAADLLDALAVELDRKDTAIAKQAQELKDAVTRCVELETKNLTFRKRIDWTDAQAARIAEQNSNIEFLKARCERMSALIDDGNDLFAKYADRNEELESELAEVTRERDAAVKDLRKTAGCMACKHGDVYTDLANPVTPQECNECGIALLHFKWRGVCAENIPDAQESHDGDNQ